MLIIPVKEGENIERALKRYKKKYNSTKVVRHLRARQQFTKPSVLRREEVKKATYIQDLNSKDS
ncbi:MAG: small subunit ribosomal protein S21 [Patiriisocius sp.]|jgi:small subunit ribosomal protein S21